MQYSTRDFPKSAWPQRLLEIPQPPVHLTIRGQFPTVTSATRFLAVVGSRSCTTYGKQVCEQLVQSLAGMPVVIVSGLALGIDTIAHATALAAHIPCMAVPGSGLDDSVLYPRSNAALARRILLTNGCLLSEFEPLFRATPWSFPRRNRIMVGLSHAVLLVEAGERSGTLITARLAGEYNRDLLTVPGSIFSKNSVGVHQFLKLGAVPITCAADLHEALGFDVQGAAVQQRFAGTIEEDEVLGALPEPLSRELLQSRVSLSPEILAATLSQLELDGRISVRGGVVQKAV